MPVEGRVVWLMLVVVCRCCCQQKNLTLSTYRIVDKTTYVEVFGRLCVLTSGTKRRKG